MIDYAYISLSSAVGQLWIWSEMQTTEKGDAGLPYITYTWSISESIRVNICAPTNASLSWTIVTLLRYHKCQPSLANVLEFTTDTYPSKLSLQHHNTYTEVRLRAFLCLPIWSLQLNLEMF